MTKKSYEVLNDPFLFLGTAFTKEERKELELTGLLPPKIQKSQCNFELQWLFLIDFL